MRVLLVGDTHGNVAWLRRVVFPAAERCQADVIFQVGDFGWWPRVATNDAFRLLARQSRVPLWWIDGNHEDHAALGADVREAGGPAGDGLVHLGGNLWFVPRGSRVDMGGVTLLACGGAHSIDRRLRAAGVDWFDEEHITDADVDRCIEGGRADVLVCHDAPAGWKIPNLASDRGLPRRWAMELPACWDHRERLRRVLEAVTPELVVHGHYHSGYQLEVAMDWGSMTVVGLSEDGTVDNLALLDCVEGTWSIEAVPVGIERLR